MRLETHLAGTPEPKVREPGIRYEEVTLDNAAAGECSITEVVAGPAATPESLDEARQLLDGCGLGHVPVTLSVFRGPSE